MWYLNPIKLSAEAAHLAPRQCRRSRRQECGKIILIVEIKYETTDGKANRIDVIYSVYLHIVYAVIVLHCFPFISIVPQMNLYTNASV